MLDRFLAPRRSSEQFLLGFEPLHTLGGEDDFDLQLSRKRTFPLDLGTDTGSRNLVQSER